MLTNRLKKLVSVIIIIVFFFTGINISYATPDSYKTSAKAASALRVPVDRATGRLAQAMADFLASQNTALTPKLKSVIQTYGLSLDKVTFNQVSGPIDDKLGSPSEDQALTVSLHATNMAALTSHFNVGCALDPVTGKKRADADKRKKVADGGAVTILEKMLASIAEDLDITIIIGGSEGKTRDGAPALRVKQVINPNGKNGIYVMQTDPIENTNAQAENRSGSWSLFFLVKLPKESEVNLRRHVKRTKKGLEEFLISLGGSHLAQYNIPFCHDRYVVSVSYPGNVHADKSAEFHPANDSPIEILKAIAAEHNMTFEELCSKAHVVFLGNRNRHDYIEKALKDLQGKGSSITYSTVSDGDAFARIMSSLGVPTNKDKEFTIVFGASGAVEGFATGVVSAGVMGTESRMVGRVKMVHSSKHLDMYDLTGWDTPNTEDLADFHALGITDPSTVLTEDSFSIFPERIFIGASITGAREDIDISSNMKIAGVKIVGNNIIVSSFVLDKYGRGFIAEVTYNTGSVDSTRLSMVSDNNYGILDDSNRSVRDYMIGRLINSSDLEERTWLHRLNVIEGLSEEAKEWLRALLEMKKTGVKEFWVTDAASQGSQVKFDIDSVIDNILHGVFDIEIIEKDIVITERNSGQRNIVEARMADGRLASIGGEAILLTGGALTGQEHERYNAEVERLITTGAGNPRSLFKDRKAIVQGEKNIRRHKSESAFFKALRALQAQLPQGFDVIILEGIDNIPLDIILHPGHTRNQAYIAASDINILERMYNALGDEADKEALVKILLEGFKHEAGHVRLRESLREKSFSEIERIVDQEAPSFRVRELFRLVYLDKRISDPALKPNIKQFLDGLQKDKASHLLAYASLTPEQHLEIANILVSHSGAVNVADIVLARHHIGHVLAHELFKGGGIESGLFKQAAELLQEKNLIPNGPESKRPIPLYTFIRELIRSDMVAFMSSTEDTNIIVNSLEQLEQWQRGDETRAGDSIRFPMQGEAMALPITIERAQQVISKLDMASAGRNAIISRLRRNSEGQVIISRKDLDTIGLFMISKAAMATNGAGKGSRFAKVEAFDGVTGKPIFLDMAKGVYKIPVDGGKSFMEIFLAQVANNNKSYKKRGLTENIPVCIYTSYLTDQDIREELARIGYQPTAERDVFQHPNKEYSKVQIIRIHQTMLFDKYNGDNLLTVDPTIDWSEAMWPDAHDSSFIDLITSGVAYELYKGGKEYVFISNVDNRAATMEPALLAIMEFMGTPLLNEVSLNVGQPGGAPVKMRKPFIGKDRGLLEGWNMDQKFLQGLSSEEAKAYLPLFNTANYCVNILAYVKEAFLRPINPEATDADALFLLRQFYAVRGNAEKRALFKFKLLEARYKFESQFWEADKRYPALQPSNLAGIHTWLVDTTFVEVPQGESSDGTSRFEPQKESLYNLERMAGFLENLKTNKELDDATQLEYVKNNTALSGSEKAELAWIQATFKASDSITINGLLERVNKAGSAIRKSLQRIEAASARYYPAAKDRLSINELDREIRPKITTIRQEGKSRIQELIELQNAVFDLDPQSNIVTCLINLINLHFRLYHNPEKLLETITRQGPPFDILTKAEAAILQEWLAVFDAFENSGALKDIGYEDAVEVPGDVKDAWVKQAKTEKVETVTIKSLEIKAKFIVDEQGKMPKGMSAYHLYDNDGNLLIVTRYKVTPNSIEEEAAFHEAKEATWTAVLKDEYGGAITAEIIHAAHILAAAEEAIAFGETGITPYHTEQLRAMPIDMLLGLLRENRALYHDLVRKYLGMDFRIRVERYEKKVKNLLRELLAEKGLDVPENMALGTKVIAIDFGGTLVPGDSANIIPLDSIMPSLELMQILLQADPELVICIVSGAKINDVIGQILALHPAVLGPLSQARTEGKRFKVFEKITDKQQIMQAALQELGAPESSIIAIGNDADIDAPMALNAGKFVKVGAPTRTDMLTALHVLGYILDAKLTQQFTTRLSFNITERAEIKEALPVIGPSVLQAMDFMYERGLLRGIYNLEIIKGAAGTSAEITENTLTLKLGDISFLTEKTSNETLLYFLFVIARGLEKPTLYVDSAHAGEASRISQQGPFITKKDGIETLIFRDEQTGEIFMLAANFGNKVSEEKAWYNIDLPAALFGISQNFVVNSSIIQQGVPKEIRSRKYQTPSDRRIRVGLPYSGCEIFRFIPKERLTGFTTEDVNKLFSAPNALIQAIGLFSRAGAFEERQDIWRIVVLRGSSNKVTAGIDSDGGQKELIIQLPADKPLSLTEAIEALARAFGKLDLKYLSSHAETGQLEDAIQRVQQLIEPSLAATREMWAYKKTMYREMVKPRPVDEINRRWLEQNTPHLKDRVIVSWQLEMAFHPELSLALIEVMEKEVEKGAISIRDANILLEKIGMSSMAGGLGALMPDVVRGMADNGADMITLNIVYDRYEDGTEAGKWLKEALKNLDGYSSIKGVTIEYDGQARTIDIYLCRLGNALQVWIDGSDYLYKGVQNSQERASQIKFYNAAGLAVIKELQERGVIGKDKKLLHMENEAYTHLPKEGDSIIINHTVVAGGMPNYSESLFPELRKQYGALVFDRAGRFRPEVLGARRALRILGVSTDHTRILRDTVFPASLKDVGANPETSEEILHKIVRNNEYGSSNGTHPKHFQAPEVQDLIDKYKARFGNEAMDDNALIAYLEADTAARDRFMEELDTAASGLEARLLTLLRTQGINWSESQTMHTGAIIRRIVDYKELRQFINILQDENMRGRFKKSGVRVIIGGRFGPDKLAHIRRLAEAHQLQDQVAVFENYNISDAPIIMQGIDFTVMLSQKGKEASATTPQKVASNAGAIIAVADGICHPDEHFLEEFNPETGRGTGFIVEYDGQGIPKAESLLQCLEKMGNVLENQRYRRQIRFNNLIAWMKIGNIITHQARGILKIMDEAIAEQSQGAVLTDKYQLDLQEIMRTDLLAVNPEILSGLIVSDDLLITSIRVSAYQEMIDRGVPQNKAFQIAKGIMRSLFDEDCELMASANLVKPGEGNAIGVKVGGTSFKAAIVEPSGQIIAKGDKREWKKLTGKETKELSAEQVADLLSEGIVEIMEQHQELKSQNKVNIGISLPGQTENTEGWGKIASFGSKTPNVPFYNTALSNMIEARLAQRGFNNVEVSLMNDSFARLVGELSQNGTLGRNGWRSGTTVISGTGVNASMAIEGRPFTDGRALTELGNVVVAPLRYDPLKNRFQNQAYVRKGIIPRDDELARDGLQRLEVLINGAGLADLAHLFGFSIPGHESVLPDAEDAALRGDKKALKLIELYGRIVGKGLASIASEQNGYEQMWTEHIVLVSGVFEKFACGVSVPAEKTAEISGLASRSASLQQELAAQTSL